MKLAGLRGFVCLFYEHAIFETSRRVYRHIFNAEKVYCFIVGIGFSRSLALSGLMITVLLYPQQPVFPSAQFHNCISRKSVVLR